MRSVAVMILAVAVSATAFAQTDNQAASVIAAAAKQVDGLIKGADPLPRAAVEEVLATLNKNGSGANTLSNADFAAYSEVVVRASLLNGDSAAAMRAADAWISRGGETPDPRALRYGLLTRMLSVGGIGAEGYLDLHMNKPAYANYKPWVDYLRPLTPLLGKPIANLSLPLGGKAVLNNAALEDSLAVLYFWAVAPGQSAGAGNPALQDLARQNALLAKYAPAGTTIIGVNLDEGDAAESARKLTAEQKAQAVQLFRADNATATLVPKPLPITAVPTVVVLGKEGVVIYVGDPRSEDLSLALSCGLSKLKGHREGGRTLRGPTGPSADPAAAEVEAQKLYDDGLNYVLLGQRTHNSGMKQKGLDMLQKCVDQYPNTQSAPKAKEAIVDYSR
jgi:hypothetical protein